MSEASLHYQVAQYLKIQYPKIVFRTDFAAGIKMTMGQAIKHKSLQSGRAYPDVFIAEPKKVCLTEDGNIILWASSMIIDPCKGVLGENEVPNEKEFVASTIMNYGGLFIELKKEGTKLKRTKDALKPLKGETTVRVAGDWFDSHIQEQAEMLDVLRKKGYVAVFACGFDEAKMVIDKYLSY